MRFNNQERYISRRIRDLQRKVDAQRRTLKRVNESQPELVGAVTEHLRRLEEKLEKAEHKAELLTIHGYY